MAAGEPVVALLAAGEHEQVRADGVGLAVLRLRQLERELGAEHRLQLQRLGGLGEAHDAVEAVVVGDREGVKTQPLGLFGELFGRGRAVEERERRVRVQLGVGDRVGGPLDRRRHVRSALARPRRAVAAVGAHRHVARPAPVAEQPLHLGPRHGGVVEAHQSVDPQS